MDSTLLYKMANEQFILCLTVFQLGTDNENIFKVKNIQGQATNYRLLDYKSLLFLPRKYLSASEGPDN